MSKLEKSDSFNRDQAINSLNGKSVRSAEGIIGDYIWVFTGECKELSPGLRKYLIERGNTENSIEKLFNAKLQSNDSSVVATFVNPIDNIVEELKLGICPVCGEVVKRSPLDETYINCTECGMKYITVHRGTYADLEVSTILRSGRNLAVNYITSTDNYKKLFEVLPNKDSTYHNMSPAQLHNYSGDSAYMALNSTISNMVANCKPEDLDEMLKDFKTIEYKYIK